MRTKLVNSNWTILSGPSSVYFNSFLPVYLKLSGSTECRQTHIASQNVPFSPTWGSLIALFFGSFRKTCRRSSQASIIRVFWDTTWHYTREFFLYFSASSWVSLPQNLFRLFCAFFDRVSYSTLRWYYPLIIFATQELVHSRFFFVATCTL